MKFARLGPAVGLLCATGALCVACASGGGETSTSDDGSAPDVTTADGSAETSGPADSAPGVDSGGSAPDSTDDAPGSVSDSSADTTAPASDAGDESTTGDSASIETSTADVAVHDTGADAPPDAPGDASSCSAGPSPSYQATCMTCSISATCVLTCASCTKKDQTQNPNPTIQLPCPGTLSVSNDDGTLVCS
jgi:hypothetical protein